MMKRISYEDARARFKHQTLLQDFLELQQETEDARNNLMALKQKKLTLQAQVRFLRLRHKFLLKEKSSQEQVFTKPQPTQFTKSKKEMNRSKKQATLRKLPPPTEKKKKASPRSIQSPEFDLNLGISVHGVKEQQIIHRGIAHQRVRINGPKVSTFLDLTQEPTRKPVIDLNQISREEEELQEVFDPPMIQNEQHRYDPIYRNIGRAGKRKISWQDPVALRV